MKSKKKSVKKSTPRQFVNKYIGDPKARITDDDIKNLQISPEANENLEKEEQEKLEEIKKEIGKKPPNPYSILGE